jgi:hypothetical protein
MRRGGGDGAGTAPSAICLKFLIDNALPRLADLLVAAGNSFESTSGGPDRRLGGLRFRRDSRRSSGRSAVVRPIPGSEFIGRF